MIPESALCHLQRRRRRRDIDDALLIETNGVALVVVARDVVQVRRRMLREFRLWKLRVPEVTSEGRDEAQDQPTGSESISFSFGFSCSRSCSCLC